MPLTDRPAYRVRLAAILLLIPAAVLRAADDAQWIEEVVVRASFHGAALQRVPSSISLLPENVIRERAAQHLAQLLNVAPNVNYAAGASRGRFVQIRGVGERSQFVDPVDPSVGLVLDDIDLSGVGNAATLFDLSQVEVLRGPQVTRYGASAMAGMLVMSSNAPTDEFEGQLEASLGDYDTTSLGAVLSGPLAAGLTGRLALQRYRSDGYLRNRFYGSEDSNELDELTLRGRLNWQLAEDVNLDLSLLHLDSDNGYDAFSLDNSRKTLSDEPGSDAQETDALALTLSWDLARGWWLQGTLSAEQTDLDYGYDEDWSYAGLCDGTDCEGWEYSSTDRYLREREALGLDLRLGADSDGSNLDWVAGLYVYRRDVDLERRFFDFDLWAPARFDSSYDTRRLALYGDVEQVVNERLSVGAGLRLEQVEGDYEDSRGVDADPDDRLWGGQLNARYLLSDDTMLYALVSRGFKAGGVNGEALGKAEQGGFDPLIVDFLRQRLEFDDESLLNYEFGIKGRYLDGALGLRAAAFYMDREDMQVRAWHSEGPAFVGYLDNAEGGSNVGVELEARYQVNPYLQIDAGLGLLDTELGDFVANDVDRGFVDKGGRDQAHAPSYQFSLAASLELPAGMYGRLEWEGRDDFYFSNSHDARSDAYDIWHLTLGYRRDRIDLALWGRNLTDEDYAVRGFRFGNDPRKFYETETYVQYAAPRTLGLTVRYAF